MLLHLEFAEVVADLADIASDRADRVADVGPAALLPGAHVGGVLLPLLPGAVGAVRR